MATFQLPGDLKYNRGPVQDAREFIEAAGCSSWLLLTGDEFATMPGGIAYEQVRSAVSQSRNVVSDPPRVLDLDLAREHVDALDQLPRPTMITCRVGPRASAVAYMYSGLKLDAEPDAVLRTAEKDDAPFYQFAEYRSWVRGCIEALGNEQAQ